MHLAPADLTFMYRQAFPAKSIPEAYERLLQDAVAGDAALFMRSDEIERAWQIMEPFLAALERPGAPEPESYPLKSQGPDCAAKLLARDGRAWDAISGVACGPAPCGS
jgi:glucose-6-phosphate 1-dehydrogenase